MKCGSLVLALVIPGAALAHGYDGGVSKTNYRAGLSIGQNRTAYNGNLNVQIRAPLYKALGGSLSADVTHAKFREGNGIKGNGEAAGGSLFLQDYRLGRIGTSIEYTKARFSGENLLNSHDENTTYSLFGSYFVKDFTLSAKRYQTRDTAQNNPSNVWSGAVTWYGLDAHNIAVSALTQGMSARDHYGVGLTYQPALFHDAAALSFAYVWSPRSDSFTLSFNYYFGSPVNLEERDRRY